MIEEVLEQQPADIQTFLLQTAVLDRFTGSLCDALTGNADGHSTLETLERANLFIVPLDVERRWYRYHHLFADLLRQRLHQLYPDWVPALHQDASIWFEQNGYMDEAIEHALYAEDFERAAYLIECIAEQVWTRYEHTKLQRWLDELPEELMFSKPQLCVFHTWSLFATGQQDAAERSLQAAEEALGPAPEYDAETAQLRGRIAVTRAFLAFLRNDVQELIQRARQALDYLPAEDLMWRSTAIIALGDAHTLKGEVAEAYNAYLQAAEISRMVGSTAYRIPISLKLSVTLRSMGHLHQTIACCREHLQLANDSGMSRTVVVGFLLAVWGEVLAELNDLNSALDQVNAGVALTERGRDVIMFGWANMCLIRVLFSRGNLDRAEMIVQKLMEADRELDIPAWLVTQIAAWQVRIWLAQGKLALASQWEEHHKQSAGEISIPQLEFAHITYGRLLLAQGRLDEATKLLQAMIPITEARGRTSRAIEMLIIQALVFQAGGNMNDAMLALGRALSAAEPCGFIRMFVDEGPPMAQLLLEALKRDIMPDYARRLLAAFPTTESPQTDPANTFTSEAELIEPLSEREIEVLHLIAEGLTNPKIASRLFLSLNTIKVHARNIYDKLGVHNRTQAVTRARALGILPPV